MPETTFPVFSASNQDEFFPFIDGLLARDVVEHAQEEAERLSHIFEAVRKLTDSVPLRPIEGISFDVDYPEAYITIVEANRAMSFNGVLIIDECVKEEIVKNAKNKDIVFALPPMQSSSFDNLNLPEFGFIAYQENQQTLIIPTLIISGKFIELAEQAGCEGMLEFIRALFFEVDHDWFHTMTLNAINSDITHLPYDAPINKLEYPALGDYVNPQGSPDTFSRAYYDFMTTESGFEGWAVRLQRLFLEIELDSDEASFVKAVKGFVKCWEKFKNYTDYNFFLEDVQTEPSDYALVLFAMAIYRAVPPDYPVLNQLFEDKEALRHLRSVMSYLQSRDKVDVFAFQSGVASTAEDYDRQVVVATREASFFALNDAQRALGIAYSY